MDDFGNIGSMIVDEEPSAEQSFLEKQQKRLERMVRDPNWLPIMEMMEARMDHYRSMQWVNPDMTNDQIGEQAKVGSIVIMELEGIFNEIKAVAGVELSGGSGSSSGANKKSV